MSSFAHGKGLIASTSNGMGAVYADGFARRGFDTCRPELGGSPEAITQNGANRAPVEPANKPPQILMVDAALALHKLHLLLLRSIPALVQALASCADMYVHEEHTYAVVILALHPESKETAEAAHFVRRRWNGAKILLLANESAAIDDWLYDERVDPHVHPATVREAAIRLMADESYWISAEGLKVRPLDPR